VITVRTFSISAGLDASTVTPGRTAPVVSLTTPAMPALPCASALAAINDTITVRAIRTLHLIDGRHL
jgi:hypothetical protein